VTPKTSIPFPEAPLPGEQTQPDTAEERGRARVPDIVSPNLFVVLEGGRLAAGGARYSLADAERVVLTREGKRAGKRSFQDGASTLVLGIPDARMSSPHAILLRKGLNFVIEDGGSRNGTRLNGLSVTESTPLIDGDILEAGQTTFLYRAAIAASFDGPPDAECDPLDTAAILATLDPALARQVEKLDRIAISAVPVILLGETGTGKELIARALHRHSQRKGPIVAVNCGALPATLLEAQLFGHVRGAFSGAVGDAPGLLRSADGGTLFLDEIGDLPAPSQVALLRALQEGEVLPIGAIRPVRVDFRVVAATHQPLEELVARGAFRSDLFARLAGFTFVLPPLRARRQDLGILVAALLGDRTVRLSSDVGRALVRYDWPLNVRELRHALDAAIALAEDGVIRMKHLPPAVAQAISKTPLGSDPVHEELVASLSRHRGNISEVAREMGKARMQVQRWMRRFGIDPQSFRR
jgi:transcriptional regulator of acetoin/glycerol metabolism